MYRKLTIDDIKIKIEGAMVREAVIAKYGSTRNFHASCDSSLSLKSIKTYCTFDHITSETFKCMVTDNMNMSWDDIAMPPVKQVRRFIDEIFFNITSYRDEEDILMFDKINEMCDVSTDKALMLRNYAKYYYSKNNIDKTIELYKQAISTLDVWEANTLVVLMCELADYYYMQRKIRESERLFCKAQDYVDKKQLSKAALYTYNFRRGVVLSNDGDLEEAMKHFLLALENASLKTETMSEIGVACMAIGSACMRQKKYDQARDYYYRSLLEFHENDVNGRATILNNLADLHCKLNDYKSAAEHIEKALNILDENCITSRYIFLSETYAEIMFKIGNSEPCTRYFDMLKNTANSAIDKKVIKDSISRMIHVMNNKSLLNQLELIICYLIERTDNDIFKEELLSCIGKIYLKINGKETILHEEN